MAKLDLDFSTVVRSGVCSESPHQYDCGKVTYSRVYNPNLEKFETIKETEILLNNKFIKKIKTIES